MVKNPNYTRNICLYVACRTTHACTLIVYHRYITYVDKKVIMDKTYNIMSHE